MLGKFFRKIIMMAAPSNDYMNRHYVRVYETPKRPPKNTAVGMVSKNIKQPNGKESRRQ